MKIILDRDVQTPTKKYLKGIEYNPSVGEIKIMCLFADLDAMTKAGINCITVQTKINDSDIHDNIRKKLKENKEKL